MIIKEIINRRSVRDYKKESVPEDNILELIKAAQFAPSARNNHAIEFIVVREKKIKDRISILGGQEFVKKAPVLIIPVVNPANTPCPNQDLAVAAQNILLQATALGLGAVWKAVKREWMDGVKDLIGVPANYLLDTIIPVGYPNETKTAHTDAEFNKNKIHYEKW